MVLCASKLCNPILLRLYGVDDPLLRINMEVERGLLVDDYPLYGALFHAEVSV